jgi:hypothetical protein
MRSAADNRAMPQEIGGVIVSPDDRGQAKTRLGRSNQAIVTVFREFHPTALGTSQ